MTDQAPVSQDNDIKSLLQDDERVIVSAPVHWGIYWKAIAVAAFGLFMLTKLFNLGLFLIFVSALMWAHGYLTKHYLRLVLTDKRVIVRYGIINLDTVQIHINKVESVELARTIMARLLGYAAVMITGTGSRVTIVPFVAEAEAFRHALDKEIFAREESKS